MNSNSSSSSNSNSSRIKAMTDTMGNLRRSVGVVVGALHHKGGNKGGDSNSNSNTITVSIKRSREFVVAALTEGTQILPCYSFGSSDVFGSSSSIFGIPPVVPLKRPLLTVVGRPIQCPHTPAAMMTPELVHEFHQIYLSEIKRIFDSYKNTYGWTDKKIVFVN